MLWRKVGNNLVLKWVWLVCSGPTFEDFWFVKQKRTILLIKSKVLKTILMCYVSCKKEWGYEKKKTTTHISVNWCKINTGRINQKLRRLVMYGRWCRSILLSHRDEEGASACTIFVQLWLLNHSNVSNTLQIPPNQPTIKNNHQVGELQLKQINLTYWKWIT